MHDFKGSSTEKQVAKRAFNAALEREYGKLMHQTREMVARMQEGADLWRLHDFLTHKRREIDEEYDYRYSQLIRSPGSDFALRGSELWDWMASNS